MPICVSCRENEAHPNSVYDEHCTHCDDARDAHEFNMTVDRVYAWSWRERQRELEVQQYGVRGE